MQPHRLSPEFIFKIKFGIAGIDNIVSYFRALTFDLLPLKSRQQQLVFYAIIVAQFCGTSLWFAGNAALPFLQSLYNWPSSALGYLTSATQLGFITGTLSFALLGLSDRYSPSKVFVICSVIAGASNLIALADISSYLLVLVSRFLVGFFLAGIYPVGMKIASDWKEEGLGQWLGALVGALTLGTAFPHALKLLPQFVSASGLLTGTSLLSFIGALIILFLVPDGPYRKKSSAFSFAAVRKIFTIKKFRSPSFGYFGHMWELYTFWAFVPWIVFQYEKTDPLPLHPFLFTFLIIACGFVSCIAGGQWASRIGSLRIAAFALICSGLCCLLSPLIWGFSPWLFIVFMIFWGMTVVADSPQFSALVARSAPDDLRGSAITLVTCIGFSITIFSIQLLNYLQSVIPHQYLLLLLVPGPVLGVIFLSASLPRSRHIEPTKITME